MISVGGFTHRLGNQLFQLAAAISLAEDNLDKVAFPEWKYSKYFEGDFTPTNAQVDFICPEKVFHYEQIPYKRNLAVQGYRQSEKYFKNNEKLIRRVFTLKPEYERYISGSVLNIIPSCSLHVRRTDYLDPQNKPCFYEMTMDYYRHAMKIMTEIVGEVNFFVFSDDLAWCEENFTNIPNCSVVGSPDEIQDFSAMKNCDHNIIGNSSFSWWSAYLNHNPHKLVIAPSQDKWFGPALSHYDTSDLIPPSWIRI